MCRSITVLEREASGWIELDASCIPTVFSLLLTVWMIRRGAWMQEGLDQSLFLHRTLSAQHGLQVAHLGVNSIDDSYTYF